MDALLMSLAFMMSWFCVIGFFVLGIAAAKNCKTLKSRISVFSLFTIIVAVALFTMPGCRPSVEPGPQPGPNPQPQPQPPDQAMSVVFVTNWQTESPQDVAVYTSPDLINFCKQSNHELRVTPVEVVDEGRKNPPEYLRPYIEEAKAKGTPIMVLGRAGKVKKSVFPMPTSAQAAIAAISGVAGTAPDANEFWANGEYRKLSLLPLKAGAEDRWASEPPESLVPEKDWVNVDLRYMVEKIKNQDGYSCCASDMTRQSVNFTESRMGIAYTPLSCVDLYSRVNGGRDAGSSLEDNLHAAMEGICSTATAVEYGVTKTQHRGDWQKDRSKHAIQFATICPTFAHMASALQKRRCVGFGIMVTSGFTPDAQGVIGPKRGGSRGGHAILAVGMKKIGDEWYILMCNSWGEGWGQGGFAWLHNSWFEPAFGAFAVVSLVSPSDQRVSELLSSPNRFRPLTTSTKNNYQTAP